MAITTRVLGSGTAASGTGKTSEMPYRLLLYVSNSLPASAHATIETERPNAGSGSPRGIAALLALSWSFMPVQTFAEMVLPDMVSSMGDNNVPDHKPPLCGMLDRDCRRCTLTLRLAVNCLMFGTVERNSERAWQEILACSSPGPHLKKSQGGFKL
jgi:hypothetical protein